MAGKIKEFSLSILLTFSLLSLSLSNTDFTALLAFKSSLDLSNSLSSWSNSSSSSDHCSWLGVTCNPSTHRVTKLVLNELNLSGSIQPLTRLTHLRHLSLHHNRLSSAPTNFTYWPNLKHLYLSHNLIAGKFPDGISRLRRLHRLDLSYNQFSGEIPVTELTQLPHLLTIRLEFNSFTGTLNSSELSSTSISDFNVSGNDFVGKIPNWLSKFPVSSFTGNQKLCGDPLTTACPNRTMESNRTTGSDSVQNGVPGDRKKRLSNRAVLTIISIDVVAVMAALLTLSCCCYKRGYRYRERKREEVKRTESFYSSRGVVTEGEEMVYFEGCKGYTKVDDLLKASAEMLGKGSAGTTYKVVMDGGDVVVVKRVRERRRKEIDGFLKVIGGLRHPNIVGLRACHSSKDELLLVYDFLPNGSLHFLLHGNRGPGRTPLEWSKRLKLASGSAQGLAFLHSYNKSKLFHGHLTTSNIIVDDLGNACLSDIGLHQLLPAPSSSNLNNPYRAPQLMMLIGSTNQNGKLLQRCDVYSFGVVLVEILTGKMAESEGEDSLGKWVQGMVSEKETWEVLDFELLSNREKEEEMVALLQVALRCLAPSSRDRPTMGTVHRMIEGIRGGTATSGSFANDLSSDSSPSLSESTPNFISSC